MTVGDGRDGWTPKPSLEISHGEFTFLPSPAVPDAAPVVPAPQKKPRQSLSLEGLAAFEASKRRPSARRAERCIGLAIRKGQAEGRIRRRGDVRSQGTTDSPDASFSTTKERVYAYAMADNVSEEAFEAADERIRRAIDALAAMPRPAGVVKMHGSEGYYRLRVGDYRVVYEIEDDVLTVLVVRIGHRREVYR